jgi:multicomponent K+:H+ antiporter subunit E
MKLLPYPRVWLGLVAMWLIVNGSIAPGHILLGVLIATVACWAVVPLEPPGARPRRIGTIIALVGLVLIDIVRSNVGVLRLLLSGRNPRSAFITIPLELKDQSGLAILACIVTATPGSAWIEHDSAKGTVLVHVLDTEDEAGWVATLKRTYEKRLQEIFE